MKKSFYKLVGLLIFSLVKTVAFAQPYTLEIQIKNLPGNHIILGKVTGDNFIPLDTLLVNPVNPYAPKSKKEAKYKFPKEAKIGMYRLILGQTTYAKVMNEAPQQLDFIFNNESLIFETDFEEPENKMSVILSEENRLWFTFIQKEKVFIKELKELEMEVNYCLEKQERDTVKDSCSEYIIPYNSLQKQHDSLITKITTQNPDLLASKMIKMYREPYLDGNLTTLQRRELFQKEFFKLLDFSDERLINSSVYSDRIFYFLTSYKHPGQTKEQLEEEYIKAVDIILAHTNQNSNVYAFIIGYMKHGFEVLEMDKVIDYINKNYSGAN